MKENLLRRSLKTPISTNIINYNNKETSVIAHDALNSSPGYGMLCASSNNKSSQINSLSRIGIRHKEKQDLTWLMEEDGLKNIDKKTISMLKAHIKDITKQLQSAILNKNESEYKAVRSEERLNTFKEALKLRSDENEKLSSIIKEKDKRIGQLNQCIEEYQSQVCNFKKEIESLNSLIKVERNKIAEMNSLHARRQEELNEENKTLMTQLQKLSTALDEESQDNINVENNNNMLEISSSKNRLKSDRSIGKSNQKLAPLSPIKENKLQKPKPADIKITASSPMEHTEEPKRVYSANKKSTEKAEFKLHLEILDLKERLEKLDASNQNLHLVIRNKKDIIQGLMHEIEKYKEMLDGRNDDLRWQESIVKSKLFENKLLKEKIEKMKYAKVA